MECVLKHCTNKQRGGGYCKQHYLAYVFLPKRPLYATWNNIKRRCRDESYPRYSDWGGRGITICEKWFNDYFAFEKAVGPKPSPFHQLDRKNNNGNYEPGNVRWTSATLQARNRRRKSTNSSGYTGVEVVGPNAYTANITVNKKRIHLGTFRTIKRAIQARAAAQAVYF